MRRAKHWLIVSVLALLMLGGAVAGVVQLSTGLGATALHEPVVWGLYVVCFVFFAGLGAGALTVASATIGYDDETYRPVARVASLVVLVALMIAGIFITIDLGRPERAILMLLKPNLKSPLIWDFVILNAMIGLAAVYLFILLRVEVLARGGKIEGRIQRLLTFRAKPDQPAHTPRIIRLLAAVMVIGVPVLYLLTARVFTSLRARPAWNTTVLGPVFLVSAMLSGLAAVVVVGRRLKVFQKTDSTRRLVRLFVNIMILLIVVDLVFFFSPFVTMRPFDGDAPETMSSLFHVATALELVVGLLVPLALLAATRKKEKPRLVLPCVMVLFGIFVKRWHIIIPAMLKRNLPLPEASYVPNLVECSIVVGVIAFGILLIYLATEAIAQLSAARDVEVV